MTKDGPSQDKTPPADAAPAPAAPPVEAAAPPPPPQAPAAPSTPTPAEAPAAPTPAAAEPVAAAPAAEPKRGLFGRRREKIEAAPPPPPPPPPPPSRRRARNNRWSERAKHPFIAGANALISVLIVFGLLLLMGVEYAQQSFREPGPLESDKAVIIGRGAGSRDIAEQLKREGIIENTWLFAAGVQFTGQRDKLKAGEYLIPARASAEQVIDILASGKVIEHPVTVPEGLTTQQIVDRLMSEAVLTGEVRDLPPEGTLLPETYRVTRGTTRAALLQRMTEAQRKVVDEVWAKRDSRVPVKSPQELVTLASIVEKETGIASERPRVAAVFVNRLQKNMRLQSDPTIIYGLVGGKGTLGRPILRSEIARATPYNTYSINGLPPGPIANPGRASLEAAARPAATNDLYFVADGSGGHAFADTYDEHQRNVARWREVERTRGAGTDRADPDAVLAPAAAPATAPAATQPARPAGNNRRALTR